MLSYWEATEQSMGKPPYQTYKTYAYDGKHWMELSTSLAEWQQIIALFYPPKPTRLLLNQGKKLFSQHWNQIALSHQI